MKETILNYGSKIVQDDGLLVSLHDRHGTSWVRMDWSQKRLKHAELRLPNGSSVSIRPQARQHAVLGLCDAVVVNGRQQTFFSSVDWAQPAFIPAMDNPGRLPGGAGSAIINLLAYLAPTTGLRYRGPYPTAALFDTLSGSFAVQGDPGEALARFIERVESRALSGELLEVPVLFTPSPCELLSVGEVMVVLRDGIERIVADGRTYSEGYLGTRRLRKEGNSIVAYVDIGGEPWVDIVRCGLDGELQEGPLNIPSFDHVLNGEPVPEAMVALVKAVISEGAPDLLKSAVGKSVDQLEWLFGDAGGEHVIVDGQQATVHSLLVERLAARSPERFLRYIVQGARPHLLRRAQALVVDDVAGIMGQ